MANDTRLGSLESIAERINSAMPGYRMAKFQELRKRIHRLPRTGTRKIFAKQAIWDDYAFHWGGRQELQYNIGFEEDESWFRYGVAFSLEPSQSLPDPLLLEPKVHKMNEYVRRNLSNLSDLCFWYWQDTRSPILSIQPAPAELIRRGVFLFWGKLCPRDDIDADEVLFLFDRLLPAYEYVEGNIPLRTSRTNLRKGLKFRHGCPDKPDSAIAQTKGAKRQVMLYHNTLQKILHKALCTEFGELNVGSENDSGRGMRIDLVVHDGEEFDYYEIKPYPCIRICLREAISQLLEYSYWPGGNRARRLVVVSENELTADSKRYLHLLRHKFRLPVHYRRIDMDSGRLSGLE